MAAHRKASGLQQQIMLKLFLIFLGLNFYACLSHAGLDNKKSTEFDSGRTHSRRTEAELGDSMLGFIDEGEQKTPFLGSHSEKDKNQTRQSNTDVELSVFQVEHILTGPKDKRTNAETSQVGYKIQPSSTRNDAAKASTIQNGKHQINIFSSKTTVLFSSPTSIAKSLSMMSSGCINHRHSRDFRLSQRDNKEFDISTQTNVGESVNASTKAQSSVIPDARYTELPTGGLAEWNSPKSTDKPRTLFNQNSAYATTGFESLTATPPTKTFDASVLVFAINSDLVKREGDLYSSTKAVASARTSPMTSSLVASSGPTTSSQQNTVGTPSLGDTIQVKVTSSQERNLAVTSSQERNLAVTSSEPTADSILVMPSQETTELFLMTSSKKTEVPALFTSQVGALSAQVTSSQITTASDLVTPSKETSILTQMASTKGNGSPLVMTSSQYGMLPTHHSIVTQENSLRSFASASSVMTSSVREFTSSSSLAATPALPTFPESDGTLTRRTRTASYSLMTSLPSTIASLGGDSKTRLINTLSTRRGSSSVMHLASPAHQNMSSLHHGASPSHSMSSLHHSPSSHSTSSLYRSPSSHSTPSSHYSTTSSHHSPSSLHHNMSSHSTSSLHHSPSSHSTSSLYRSPSSHSTSSSHYSTTSSHHSPSSLHYSTTSSHHSTSSSHYSTTSSHHNPSSSHSTINTSILYLSSSHHIASFQRNPSSAQDLRLSEQKVTYLDASLSTYFTTSSSHLKPSDHSANQSKSSTHHISSSAQRIPSPTPNVASSPHTITSSIPDVTSLAHTITPPIPSMASSTLIITSGTQDVTSLTHNITPTRKMTGSRSQIKANMTSLDQPKIPFLKHSTSSTQRMLPSSPRGTSSLSTPVVVSKSCPGGKSTKTAMTSVTPSPVLSAFPSSSADGDLNSSVAHEPNMKPTDHRDKSADQLFLLIILATAPAALIVLIVIIAFVLYKRCRRKKSRDPVYSIKVEYQDEARPQSRSRWRNSRLDLNINGIRIDLEFPNSEKRRSNARISGSPNLTDAQLRELQFLSKECKENLEWINEVLEREMESPYPTIAVSEADRLLGKQRDSLYSGYSEKEKENFEVSEKLIQRERGVPSRESSPLASELWKGTENPCEKFERTNRARPGNKREEETANDPSFDDVIMMPYRKGNIHEKGYVKIDEIDSCWERPREDFKIDEHGIEMKEAPISNVTKEDVTKKKKRGKKPVQEKPKTAKNSQQRKEKRTQNEPIEGRFNASPGEELETSCHGRKGMDTRNLPSPTQRKGPKMRFETL
ncbi:mucin-12 [Nematostella vectensis]|uniref:mucin-12 n=1 Tax=Nematostella vectensis TaxID=45351 RepID=UPI00139018CC|nr:mucin-12 [Nematostella vectensis]